MCFNFLFESLNNIFEIALHFQEQFDRKKNKTIFFGSIIQFSYKSAKLIIEIEIQ